MLLPTLVKENSDSEAILLPPRYLDDVLLQKFDSSPSIFKLGEQFFTGGGSEANPPKNEHEKLFGALGMSFRGSVFSIIFVLIGEMKDTHLLLLFKCPPYD